MNAYTWIEVIQPAWFGSDQTYGLYITPDGLYFGLLGPNGVANGENLRKQYSGVEPGSPDFYAIHPKNFAVHPGEAARMTLQCAGMPFQSPSFGCLQIWLADRPEKPLEFSIASQRSPEQVSAALRLAFPRLEVVEDPQLRIHETPGELYISLRDSQGSGLALLLFGLFWTGLTLTAIWQMFSGSGTLIFNLGALLLLPAVLIGPGLMYWGLLRIVNHTELVLREGCLEVHSRPLPPHEDRHLEICELAGVDVVQRLITRQTEYGPSSTMLYELVSQDQDGEALVLVTPQKLLHAIRMRDALRSRLPQVQPQPEAAIA